MSLETTARIKHAGKAGIGRAWETPPEIFGPLHREFNFDVDACASEKNAKLPRFWTEKDNGLAQDWAPLTVWMNCPYGREIYAWTKKAREESQKGALVVGLLPASTDLAWWHDDVLGHAEVRFVRGRIRFLENGIRKGAGFIASVIVVWRPQLITSWSPAR